MPRKSYDQAYFDRWYRNPAERVITAAELTRKVQLTLAVTEFHLGRPVGSVLDVGCGEGAWRAPLLQLRPQLDYLGLEASEYAVTRYGRTRNIRPLRFGQLAEQRFDEPVDLLICADVMHYVATAELNRGLSGFAELCRGVAYLEVMTASDDFVGDHEGYLARSAGWYRKAFARAGLIACGNHCYLSEALRRDAMALELI
jgi:SAM-dependent methyltransferase